MIDTLRFMYDYVEELDCGYVIVGQQSKQYNCLLLGLLDTSGNYIMGLEYFNIIYSGLNVKYPKIIPVYSINKPHKPVWIDLRDNTIKRIPEVALKAESTGVNIVNYFKKTPYIEIESFDKQDKVTTFYRLDGKQLTLPEGTYQIDEGVEDTILITSNSRLFIKDSDFITKMDFSIYTMVSITKHYYVANTRNMNKSHIINKNGQTIKEFNKMVKIVDIENQSMLLIITQDTHELIGVFTKDLMDISNEIRLEYEEHKVRVIHKKLGIILETFRTAITN